MPESTPREYDQKELDALLEEAQAILPDVVHQVCHKLGYHPGEAELAGRQQDLIVTLLDHDCCTLRSFERGSKLSTWLFTIAKHQIQHWLEQEREKVDIDDVAPNSLKAEASQEEELLRKEKEALAAQAISQLNPEEQTVITMTAEGKSTKEIAQALGKFEGTVNTMRSRTKARLRKMLTPPRKK